MTDVRDDLRGVARTLRRLAEWDREDNLIGYPSDSPDRLAALVAQIPRRTEVAAPTPDTPPDGAETAPLVEANTRPLILSDGPSRSSLAFVAAADDTGDAHPFAGAAGELLDKMIGAMGLRRQDVVLLTLLAGAQGDAHDDRALADALVDALELLAPEVVVTVGVTPLRILAGPAASLQSMRGQLSPLQFPNGHAAELMATLPPAHLLTHPGDKRGVWEDLRRVMGALGLPGGIPRGPTS